MQKKIKTFLTKHMQKILNFLKEKKKILSA